ncbi:MAG TPA: carboxypeptidase-like regulatory domain-containing protein [Chryseosolibacter sp.]|nr:carboxypeptidase-like regulatory domain-containing protein [Chryseosolibacter sp.]
MIMTFLAVSSDSFAQQQPKRVIQLSGVTMDTTTGPVPFVNIYVPAAGRGVKTNEVGFFSLPVLAGDSVVISSVGYQRQFYVVPYDADEYLTIFVNMVQDVTYLKEVEILPYPTEEVFKEAVLALNLPPAEIDEKNLNAELLALMLKTTPMNGPLNQRYSLNQWAASQNDKFMPVTNPFLNPFNWVKFFNGLKKGKKK